MTLLTTKQVQDLFKVDKSTIYRMAEDGRIPAVKVGRQWRFPSDKLDDLLGGGAAMPTTASQTATQPSAASLDVALSAGTAQAIADLAADLFGVMAVVTDMTGGALTEVANPCGYFTAAVDGEFTADRCAAEWRRLGEAIDLEPRFLASDFGFLCARSFIRQGSSLIGMVIVGGVAPAVWPPADHELAALAATTGIERATLLEHVNEVYWIDEAHQEWIVHNLSRVGDLLSQLADSRAHLISRLERIASLAGATTQTTTKEPK